MNEFTKKSQALDRFSKKHTTYSCIHLNDAFYVQASLALGICNISTWVRIEDNDPRWDSLFKE